MSYGVDLSTIRKQLTHADSTVDFFPSRVIVVAESYVVVASSFAFPPTSSSSSEESSDSSAQPLMLKLLKMRLMLCPKMMLSSLPTRPQLKQFLGRRTYGVYLTGGGNNFLRRINTLLVILSRNHCVEMSGFLCHSDFTCDQF